MWEGGAKGCHSHACVPNGKEGKVALLFQRDNRRNPCWLKGGQYAQGGAVYLIGMQQFGNIYDGGTARGTSVQQTAIA